MSSQPGFWGALTGASKSGNYEEAADLYVQAANQYRIRKQGAEAGKLFEKAAHALTEAGSKDEAANVLVDGFKCYKQEDAAAAARCLEGAIGVFVSRGQFRRSANFKMDLGQLYEEQLGDVAGAVAAYQDAGDWFDQDGAQALANKAFIKAADLLAVQDQFVQADELYQKILKSSVNNSNSRWALKDYFMKIVLLKLAADDRIGAMKFLDESLSMDPSFRTTREYDLLTKVVEAVNDGDSEKLSSVLFDYDQYSKLDKWKTTILLKIKNGILQADDDLL